MLPTEISISIAAKLAGCSIDRFRRDVLPFVGTPVDRARLEAYRGSEITVAEWVAADRYLAEGQRRRQVEYRARQRDCARMVEHAA